MAESTCIKTRVYFKLIVAVGVTQVAGPDLGIHVPAVEGNGRELKTAAIKGHARHARKRVPAQTQLAKPIVPFQIKNGMLMR